MRSGIVILNLFAAVWACAALGSLGAATWTWLLPLLVSAAVLALSWRVAGARPAPAPDVRRRIVAGDGTPSILSLSRSAPWPPSFLGHLP